MKSTLQFFLETKRYEVTRLWPIFTLLVWQDEKEIWLDSDENQSISR